MVYEASKIVGREVYNELHDLVKHLIKSLEDDEGWYDVANIVTRETLKLLDEKGCLKPPASKDSVSHSE